MKRNTLFCVVAKSSVGKDTVVQCACKNMGVKAVKSYATRPRRKNEGDTHIFITPEEVEQYRNDMVAYTRIGFSEYFTTKTQLLDPEIKFYIIDPNGVKYLKEKFTERPIVVVYIYANPILAESRALSRGDSLETYTARKNAEQAQFEEFVDAQAYDYWIDNSTSLHEAVNHLQAIVIMEDSV